MLLHLPIKKCKQQRSDMRSVRVVQCHSTSSCNTRLVGRNDKVIVLADAAERPEEIDRARAERARERAERRLSGRAADDVDFARAQAALMRALMRLHVAARVL